MAAILSKRKMYWIMMYATPFIAENLASLDFLNANVKRVDSKLPFYDDDTPHIQAFKKKGTIPFVRTRTTIHLKDSWVIRFSVREKDNVAVVKLSNTKQSKDGWNVADLLWEGTKPYNVNAPAITLDVPIMYKSVADPGVQRTPGWKGLATAFKRLNQLQGKTIRQTLIKGHDTGKMTFYNRYTNHWNYNRTSRRGIRDELITSFREYIVKCVEDGVTRAIDFMTDEGILRTRITGIHVKAIR